MIFLGNVKAGGKRYGRGDAVPDEMDPATMALLLENGLAGPGEDVPTPADPEEPPGPESGEAPVETQTEEDTTASIEQAPTSDPDGSQTETGPPPHAGLDGWGKGKRKARR